MRCPRRIYYLHPLLAGKPPSWSSHLDRARALGFDAVLMAPPFATGASGEIFLTADHDHLHDALGGDDALPALSIFARMAGERGLEAGLDLVVDRLAREHQDATPEGFYRPDEDEALPPDPRKPPIARLTALLAADRAEEAVQRRWLPRLKAWTDSGIRLFRCTAPARLPGWLWRDLIDGTRRQESGAHFIAWTEAISPDETRDLANRGFDLAASSTWAWDFGADWLDAETARLSAVAPLLAMPEAPFGRRLGAGGQDAACRRAIDFAAAFGNAWLVPMGLEFGTSEPLPTAGGNPALFESWRSAPRFDLSPAVIEANRRIEMLPEAGQPHLLSAPFAPIAAFLREGRSGQTARLILVNPGLAPSVPINSQAFLPAVAGILETGGETPLAGGEVRILPLAAPPPVKRQTGGRQAALAACRASRIAIETLSPAVDHGRFPAKAIAGQTVSVRADIICDGHEAVAARLLWRAADETAWREAPMRPEGNDRFAGDMPLARVGRYHFTVEAWIDRLAGFREELAKKHAAGQSLELELREGAELVAELASSCPDAADVARALAEAEPHQRLALLLSPDLSRSLDGPANRAFLTRYDPAGVIDVDRKAATFAAWYEIFPRSQAPEPGRHGKFADVIAQLPRIRDMGFDVLYFPPIHPIGERNRKGRNNALFASAEDPGSPYAIGSRAGGHDALHPELGTFDDFRRLLDEATRQGIEIALDFAVQCSPDHPWLTEHPEWFSWRADGSIRHAENPPKRYEDIVNVAFYAEGAIPSLWLALKDIVLFWIGRGIRIFRVDNPHTKPLPFWEWMIGEVRARHPDVIFLAEAFTRPKLMYRLAKAGFTQSYTYFTWRNSAWEMRSYLEELADEETALFFRPHFFVNTPDINPFFLQKWGRPAFLLRAALAATLSGLWGVYDGFELCEVEAIEGREEYADSEKYQLRQRDHGRPGNIVAEIRALNRIRRSNPALHSHLGVTFLSTGDDALLCYLKTTPNRDNLLLIAATFDMETPRAGQIDLGPDLLGQAGAFIAEDMMYGGNDIWQTGPRPVRLDPAVMPFAIWRLRPAAGRDGAA